MQDQHIHKMMYQPNGGLLAYRRSCQAVYRCDPNMLQVELSSIKGL